MPFSTIFKALLLNVLQFLYWIFFAILPHKMLDYMLGSADSFVKSQTVNIFGFACFMVCVATIQSDIMAKKQPGNMKTNQGD